MAETVSAPAETNGLTQVFGTRRASLRRRGFKVRRAILVFFVAYALVTLVPFYLLFVRTFISTNEATELHLWPPPVGEINMDYGLGNMSVFFNLDLELVKKDFGIPEEVYLNPRWSLRRLGEEFDIPEKEIAGYFRPFTRFNGWIVLFRDEQFFPALFRTLAVTTVSIIGLNLLSLCTGTALAGLKHRYQIRVYNLYLMTVFIPAFLIVLPQFLIISRFTSLIPGYAEPGTTREVVQLLTLVAMYISGGALSTMIFTSYISTIPRDLEESAEIDGASRWQYMRYVLLPLCKTPVASLTVIVLPWFWNDFFTAFVYLDPRYATLLPLIQSFTGQYTTNFQVVFTGVFVSILPLLIVYLVFRRAFIKGALAGALKG